MRIHSIRVKVMLPIISLAIILIGLFTFMLFMNTLQKNVMKRHAEQYFEAITKALNADRDIYQARLAQEKMLAGEGEYDKNLADFNENAQQVFDRFQLYRSYLADEGKDFLTPFVHFEDLYQEWIKQSRALEHSMSASQKQSAEWLELGRQFSAIRNTLDQAGEKLHEYTVKVEKKATLEQMERYFEAMTEILNADRDLYQARLAQQHIMNGVDSLEKNKIAFEQNAEQVIERFNRYRSYLRDEPDLLEAYSGLDTQFNEWLQNSRQFLENQASQHPQLLPEQFAKVEQAFNAIRVLLDKAGELVHSHSKTMETRMNELIASYENIAMIIVAVAFILSGIFGYIVPLRLTRSIEHIALRIREIADGDGDLTQRINSTAKDELGDLSNEFDLFVKQLQIMIRNINNQSHSLGGVTSKLKQASHQTTSITDTLSKASESIVSAGHEMNMSNQQMADVATNTASEATTSNKLTQEGIEAVNSSHQSISNLVKDTEEALKRTKELEESSESIASVLEVIRNIAEQTNLLALNAAIEAARAGEQGRGFAVVADEVRTLATRTQDSTNEIETMISQLKDKVHASSISTRNSQTNVSSTVSNFERVMTIFTALKDSFAKVQNMAAQTAQATQEQSQVANEINENLIALKSQTDAAQGVSNLIQEQASQINDLYSALDQQVGSFKV